MEKDPQRVAQLARQREDENWHYDDRPDCCRGYPYIGGQIAPRMAGIIERAGTCPIVHEMLERLKDAVGFRRYR